MKMNKKGFTLIEMLVVIAIIAVLVSIIIPTVTSATDKAAAATNAANLRSYKAAVTTAFLADAKGFQWNGTAGSEPVEGATVTFTSDAKLITAPTAKKMAGVEEGATVVVKYVGGEFKVYFQNKKTSADKLYSINDFALVAEKGGNLGAGTTIK